MPSASYLAFSMILCSTARGIFQADDHPQRTDPPTLKEASSESAASKSRLAGEKRAEAIFYAHQAATILRDFRERYGLKISPAWLLQLLAVASGVLLDDPELSNPSNPMEPGMNEAIQGPIQDSRTAFDEVFRCLLGTSVEVMIARGIARMMYHTAIEQKVPLSNSTHTMLHIMSNTSWRPSDLSLVNSAFPNFATIGGQENIERMTDLLVKWEKLEV